MTPSRRFDELPLWTNLAVLFPLFVWRSAYDSFHEPKHLLLSMAVGGMIFLSAAMRRDPFRPRTPLDFPIWVALAAALLAWRWDAPDRWITLTFWLRLGLMYLLFRLSVLRFLEPHQSAPGSRGAFDLAVAGCFGLGFLLKEWFFSPQPWGPAQVWSLLLAGCLTFRWFLEHRLTIGAYASREPIHRILDGFLVAGVGVAILTVLQDWGVARWSHQPVSDWRFHLSSTLGNPNEVGGYLSYLLPAVLYRFWTAPTKRVRGLWGGIGLVYLYALTTVFTVGAWLGLFVVLPVSVALFVRQGEGDAGFKRRIWLSVAVSIGLFLLLQGAMRTPIAGGMRILVLLGGGGLLLLAVGWGASGLGARPRRLAILALSGLIAVWGTLLPPWGISNHPRGLVEEAVSSPRWQGGFGARRFIWMTTGLMVKDHPIRGIGWGHYYPVHAAYQGALYAGTDKPHDRPTVGLVPQVHSDPLQVLAEAGPLGSIAFFALGAAAFSIGVRRRTRRETPEERGLHWATWTGLGLIAFHSAVDFPLRQPQPALLAVFFLSVLATLGMKPRPPRRCGGVVAVVAFAVGFFYVGLGYAGLQAQVDLKAGFESSMPALGAPESSARRERLRSSADRLERIVYPLPETHDRWLYLARIRMGLGDNDGALAALEEARKHRHSLALYQAWKEYGQRVRSPRIVLDAVRGMIRYNPNWSGFHQEAAGLHRLLGEEEEARESERLARKFRVD